MDDEAIDTTVAHVQKLFKKQAIGAVLVEPIQGRAGIREVPLKLMGGISAPYVRNIMHC